MTTHQIIILIIMTIIGFWGFTELAMSNSQRMKIVGVFNFIVLTVFICITILYCVEGNKKYRTTQKIPVYQQVLIPKDTLYRKIKY